MSAIVPLPGGRTHEQLVRYMSQEVVANAATVTDLNPLSVLRTLVEIAALLGERWEEELLVRVAEGIDRSTYRSFGFPQLTAARAYGVLRIERVDTAEAQVVPRGTQVRVPGTSRTYTTQADATLAIGEDTVDVTLLADAPGSAHNTNADTVTEFLVTPAGAELTATNPAAILSGRDDETDETRRVRFSEWVQTIHRATADAISYGAATARLLDASGIPVESVRSAQTVDELLPGTATCYIWNGEVYEALAPAASPELRAEAQRVVDGYTALDGAKVPGYKAAGAAVTVAAATIVPVDVAVEVYPAPGWTLAMVRDSVEVAIENVFARQRVGDPYLRLADLRNAVGGVRGIVDHAFGSPVPINDPAVAPAVAVPIAIVDPVAAPSISIASASSVANPTSAPTLTVQSGGSFAAGTYTIGYSYANGLGETLLSPTANVVVGATQAIRIGSVAAWAGASWVHVYISIAPGSSTLTRIGTLLPGQAGIFQARTFTGYDLAYLPPTGALTPPSATNTTSAGLPAGNYRVKIAFANANGKTIASPATATQTLISGQRLFIHSIVYPTNATEARLYLETNASGNYLLAAVIQSPLTQVTIQFQGSGEAAPSANNSAGGALPAGAYEVAYAYQTTSGHTALSPRSSITIGANSSIKIGPVGAPPVGVIQIDYYISDGPGGALLLANYNADGGLVVVASRPSVSLPPGISPLPAPAANTTANVVGGAGQIIVLAALAITEGR